MINKKNRNLVILTKKFGYNFTGATVATHALLKYWTKEFDDITIITREVGKYDNNLKIRLLKAKSALQIIDILKNTKDSDAVYYSDDHMGYLMKLCGIKYYHTYHGNWPDARRASIDFRLKSLFFIPAYKLTLKNAELVINVSYYMEKYTRNFNKYTTVIRNGLGQKTNGTSTNSIEFIKEVNINNKKLNIVMIGGIDKRKYKLALKLFSLIADKELSDRINIDIYGGIQDKDIGSGLNGYDFVNLKGHVNKIELDNYDVLLNTSTIENLSISVCEAIVNRVPVVCFNVGGLGEVVKNQMNGFLIPNGDIYEMERKIESIITKGHTFVFNDNLLFNFNWGYAATEYLRQFIM
ncbi:glycosyltransferase family 4 protein [uncultured Clostridium sp.]|uniref:glycosyltransferase family 4 protein n=1 Tax=uncultured Clostridium sp. TaxID=59620 RepID=UPI0032169CA7